jgi:zinc transport system substrate-binding protein
MCGNCEKRKKIVLFLSLLIAFIVVLTFLTAKKEPIASTENPTVVVSTFSLYEAARRVAGNTLHIRSIIPLGSDPHMFSPNPSHVADISKSALFIYNGGGFETWVEPLKNTLPKTTQVVDMSTYVSLLQNDPHYWLDIDNMIKMTQVVDSELSKLSPDKAEIFHKNAAAYIAELQTLKEEYKGGLAECKNRTLVTNHDAFGYLAHANKLENISVIGLSSDEQPSSQTIAKIIEIVKKDHIKTIFFEELISDNVAQTIAHETGARAQPLQPLENISEDELKSHQTYLSIMRENLKKLREAMECR